MRAVFFRIVYRGGWRSQYAMLHNATLRHHFFAGSKMVIELNL